MLLRGLLTSVLCAAALASTICSAAPLKKQLDAWKIEQKGGPMGDRVIYFCDSGYRAGYTKSNYTMMSSSPLWKLTYINTGRKLIHTSDLDNWKKTLGSRTRMMRDTYYPDTYKVRRGEDETIAGKRCECYIFESTRPAAGAINRSLVYVASDLVVPHQLSDFFAATWGKELSTKHVLRIVTIRGRKGNSTKLDTKSISRVKVDADFFSPPTGYKTAHSEDEVTLGNDLINDIVDDLGRQLGSGRSQK